MGKILTSHDGFKWYVEIPDDSLPLNDGEYCLRKFLINVSSKDKIFVDVGAHVGEYSVRMSKYYKHVYAIEPNPRSVMILKKNLELNNVTNVTIIPKACGDKQGILQLKLRGGSSTFLDVDQHEGVVNVFVDLLDNMIDYADVIKIDVEGFEENVIRGALKLIKKCKPIIVIEHHEFRGYNIHGSKERIRKLLNDYIALNLNGVHWAYIPKNQDLKQYKEFIAWHIFNKCIDNLIKRNCWYYGLPYTWWYGAGILDFFLALKNHLFKKGEEKWLELLD